MKFIVLGTTEFSINCAQAMLDTGNEVTLISLPKKQLPLNSTNIKAYADENKLEYHELADINSKKAETIIKNASPDYIFSSWPKIIKKNL